MTAITEIPEIIDRLEALYQQSVSTLRAALKAFLEAESGRICSRGWRAVSPIPNCI